MIMKEKLKELEVGDTVVVINVSCTGVKTKHEKIIEKFDIPYQSGMCRILYIPKGNSKTSFTVCNDKPYKVVDVDSLEDRVNYGKMVYCVDGFDYKPVVIDVISSMKEDFSEYIEILNDSINELEKVRENV